MKVNRILQMVCMLGALVVYLLLPFVVLGILGINILRMSGLFLVNAHMTVYVLPLVLYLLAAVVPLTDNRTIVLVVGGISLLATLVLMFLGGDILLSPQNVNLVTGWIPAEYSQYANTATTVLRSMIYPGFGALIAVGLNLVYLVMEFVKAGADTYSAHSSNRTSRGVGETQHNRRPRI